MRTLTFAVCLFLVTAVAPTITRAQAAKNMLWNGAFDAPALRPWTVGFESSKGGRADLTNGELCIQLTGAAPSPTAATIRQRPLALAVGHHYELRFVARATQSTRVRPRLSKIDTPYTT